MLHWNGRKWFVTGNHPRRPFGGSDQADTRGGPVKIQPAKPGVAYTWP